ncbi:Cif family virulence factor [Tenacibaculum halocynthiae]|uniref:hypothetical protein n=1 Tax=Tenacibaculum halocynthiae TaxID=1254437 RepID=UPI0038965B65
MKRFKIVLPIFIFLIVSNSFGQISKNKNKSPQQSYISHSPTKHHKVALEVLKASKTWISNFNTKNIKACLQGYSKKAVMNVTPYGVKTGKKEISNFWKPFIKSGATNLIYTNVSIEIANETTAFLSANWSMNVGKGIIFQEKWKKIEGQWLLTYDNFQILEQFNTPQENTTSSITSHNILEKVITASINWIEGFNTGKKDVCGNGYSNNATMNAVPFTSVNDKKNIKIFWDKLITDGATNLTYHNPTFSVKTNNSVILSSHWSMNIGEGKIYQEKWENIKNEWLLTYDEFQIIKQY